MRKSILFILLILISCSINKEKIQPQFDKQDNTLDEDTAIVCLLYPQVMPEFPGGVQAMHSFFKKNLQWPSNKTDLGGVVFVNFLIKPNGSIVEPGIAKGLNPDFDAEAIRVIKLMPNWIYPENPDQTQRQGMRYSLPIRFNQK
ncbi:energy transducer TonB [Xanthocytophaga agilis]|uniref:Energy transducer TonB n=1 Tax=Xanthocytophaga agilis TaxID=3048010 RepID=A0AAE3R3H0_9BACT|nr:energy transducer TonB [Xanthocytophaga agilis]MDJ1503141.1 energy transducer TonB [Xanthocytophaga agilis]